LVRRFSKDLQRMLRLGFLASGSGTNMQAILDASRSGRLSQVEPVVVISNNSSSGALQRSSAAGLPTYHLSSATHPEPRALDEAIATALTDHDVSVVALAGYMKMIGPVTLARFRGRILNIHPALLPKYGGRGFYGRAVHEAVLAAGETESGVTVHVVDEVYDHGPILAQARVPVLTGDTPNSLAARVLEQEHTLYTETLQRIAMGEIFLGS
jgi:phosphoribosylglycinamide formyltransferase-1